MHLMLYARRLHVNECFDRRTDIINTDIYLFIYIYIYLYKKYLGWQWNANGAHKCTYLFWSVHSLVVNLCRYHLLNQILSFYGTHIRIQSAIRHSLSEMTISAKVGGGACNSSGEKVAKNPHSCPPGLQKRRWLGFTSECKLPSRLFAAVNDPVRRLFTDYYLIIYD